MRLRRTGAGIAAGVILALAAPLVVMPQSAYAWPVIPPPVTLPIDAAGTSVMGGSAAAEGVGGCVTGVVLCGLLAGAAAYQGTCYLLAQIFTGTCNGGAADIWHWLRFGNLGDGRQAIFTGPDGIISRVDSGSGVWDYTHQATFRVWAHLASVNGYGTVIRESCATLHDDVSISFGSAGTTFTVTLGPGGNNVNNSLFRTAALNWDASGSNYYNTTVQCGSYPPGTPQSQGNALQIITGGSTVAASFIADAGAGTAWTTSYTETCRKGTLTATATRSVTWTPVPNGEGPVPPDMPDCNTILAGSHLETLATTGGRGGAGELTVTVPTFNAAAKSAYPLCTDNLDMAHPCFLDLRKGTNSCFDGATLCAGWPTYEAQMSCLWGPYSVPITWCEDNYRTTFDTEVATSPGPSPSTSAIPAPGFPTGGRNYDPKTGTDSTTDVGPAADSADNSANCLGGMWSWNPVDWIYIPVKCALLWAFVPDTATLTSVETSLSTSFNASGLADWGGAVSGVVGGLGGTAGGCSGPSVTFPLTNTVMHPFDACSAPMSTVASISYAFTTVVVVVLGGLAGMRAIAAGFGFSFTFGSRIKASE